MADIFIYTPFLSCYNRHIRLEVSSMSLQGLMFRLTAGRNDRKRNAATALPQGVCQQRHILYSRRCRLDVYYPEGTTQPLPTIVSIHGGGYVYGNREIYRLYCMDLARRGFAVVNFDYRLAPRWHFPAPLEDTNAVMDWICRNAQGYHLDPQRLFLVGDSAGAQIASQYAAIATDPDYAALFSLRVPPIHIRGMGLNCGMYDAAELTQGERTGVMKDYLGTKLSSHDPRFQVFAHIGKNYPPAQITTACHDFLRDNAQPMYDFLRSKGLDAEVICYGTEDDQTIGHVFHVDIRLAEATSCNDRQCAFFLVHS